MKTTLFLPFLTMICFYTLVVESHAQYVKTINGTVKDKSGAKVDNAVLIAYHPTETRKILAFTTTDKVGGFELKLKVDVDSVLIVTSHLSYSPVEMKVSSKASDLVIQLTESANILKEVEVKSNRVTRRGDTLVFDVAQMKTVKDQNIEDVLRRIPGISISPSGAISYDGLPISKFYIEGMDLLSGRYALATRNLDVRAIEEIQVLEQHQNINALRSIDRPPNAAINLKMKVAITFIHTAELGLGASDEVNYLGLLNSFGFTPKRQFAVIGALNNTGKDMGYLTRDQFLVNTSFDRLRLSKSLSANIDRDKYIFNDDQVVALNMLSKLSPTKQLKYNLGVNHTNHNVNGANILTYEIADPVQFVNEINNRSKSLALTPSVNFENNGATKYFNVKLNLASKINNNAGDQTINRVNINEEVKINDTEASVNMETVFAKGQRAMKYNMDWTFNQRTDDLFNTPSQFIDGLGMNFQFPQANQNLNITRLKGNVNSTYLKKVKTLTFIIPVGINTEIQEFTSLLGSVESGQINGLGSDFENDQTKWQLKPNATFITKSTYKKWFGEFKLPINYLYNNLTFNSDGKDQNFSGLNLSTNFQLRHLINSSKSISFNHNYFNRVNNVDIIYRGGVMTSYLNLETTQLLNLIRTQGNDVSLGFYSKNSVTSSVFGVNLKYGRFTSPSINNTIVTNTGISSVSQLGDNVFENIGLDIKWSDALFRRKVFIKTNFSTEYSTRNSLVNGVEVTQPLQNYSSSVNLEYVNSRWGGSIGASTDLSQSSFGGLAGVIDFTNSYYVLVTKKSNLSFDYIYNTILDQEEKANYINMNYKYTVGGKIKNINCAFTNVANARSYNSIFRTEFFQDKSTVNLRPRQLVVTVAFNL
jgi:hypothetical protein